jgi:hypothetical protein
VADREVVNATADLAADAEPEPSLLWIRVAATVGVLVAVAIVVGCFLVHLWVGVAALFFCPVVPMMFVLALESVRGGPPSGESAAVDA